MLAGGAETTRSNRCGTLLPWPSEMLTWIEYVPVWPLVGVHCTRPVEEPIVIPEGGEVSEYESVSPSPSVAVTVYWYCTCVVAVVIGRDVTRGGAFPALAPTTLM